jgi:tRNA 2-selenouridine synthase
MPQSLHIQEFLAQGAASCIIDVRTPKEFEQGHIPGAYNIPLFTNEERVVIGTLYKQVGRQEAIHKGLEVVGPKMADLVSEAKKHSLNNTVYVHCWRGGMRSGSVAWLYELYGFKVFVLKGGYKAYRQFVLSNFQIQSPIRILGGRTGSGKTHILHQLKEKGQQIIDLERLANHKGSAFGAIGENAQPTQEQFENELVNCLKQLRETAPVWFEDESRMIGKNMIPTELWDQMRVAPVIYVDVPFESRIKNLIDDYGKFPKEQLEASILKIAKRLGPEQTKLSIAALHNDDLRTVCEFCLHYYDKTYDYGLQNREKPIIHTHKFDSADFNEIAEALINKN